MTCGSCSSAVEGALAASPGVHAAVVSLTLQEARVEFDAALTDEVRAAGPPVWLRAHLARCYGIAGKGSNYRQ
jgi:copper chaperone CopZ